MLLTENGYPLIDSKKTDDTQGLFCDFQGGAIYWHSTIGSAFEVHGAIRDKWVAIGSEKFGYPTSDEYTTPDGEGRCNVFRAIVEPVLTLGPETQIVWKPSTGAHPVMGAIQQKWQQTGGVYGYLGYPKSDEIPLQTDGQIQKFENAIGPRVQKFENGSIAFTGGVAHDLPLSITFSTNFEPDIPLGGWTEFTINSDGHWHFTGHLHASGAPSYDVSVATVFMFKDYTGRVIGVTEEGHVNGTETFGSRSYEWDRLGFSPDIRTNFYALRTAGVITNMQANTSIEDVLLAIQFGWIGFIGGFFALRSSSDLKACGSVTINTGDEGSDENTSKPIYNVDDPCPDTGSFVDAKAETDKTIAMGASGIKGGRWPPYRA
ncbi:hypothetical protein OKW50_008290 [Paraburkholderia youngii]|uniref:LGFP repeat-containing protein n=1 Tax=Paraburkholderia youngii TaxID=2782701 RepID=UPI003D1BDD6E